MHSVNIHLNENVGAAYQQHYRQLQKGGTAVYRGQRRWQRGDGIGDVIRGITRFMLPAVMRGVTAFANETMDANERGVSLGDAAKGALKPALNSAMQALGEGFQGRQAGVGKKAEPRRKTGKRRSTKRKRVSGTTSQDGKGKRKAATKRVYKGKRKSVGKQFGGALKVKKSGKSAARKTKSRKRSNFAKVNSNF
jgi:hypothetical protein